MKLYERIRYLRKNCLNLTQEEFAEQINISRSNLGNIETDRIAITERTFKDICNQFSVNEEWLRDGTGKMFIETKNSFVSTLATEYNLDELDKNIIDCYLNLGVEQRKAVKNYLISLSKTISEEENEIDKEVANYRQEIELEKKATEKLSALQNEKDA